MPINPARLLVVLEPVGGDSIARRLRLPAKIGRKQSAKEPAREDNGIFDSKVLSRSHAEMYLQEDKIMIKDLGSSNGTFVNGEKITEPAELQGGCEVTLGVDVMNDETGEILHHRVVLKVKFEMDTGDRPHPKNAEQLPDIVVTDVRRGGKASTERESSSNLPLTPSAVATITPNSPLERMLYLFKNELQQQKSMDQNLKALQDRLTDANILLTILNQGESAAGSPAAGKAMEQVTLQRKVRHLEQQLASTKEEMKAIQANCQSLEAENRKLTEQGAAVTADASQQQQHEELKGKYSVLEARFRRTSQMATTLSESSAALEKKIETLTNEKGELQSELEKARKENKALSEDYEKLSSERKQTGHVAAIAEKYARRSKSPEEESVAANAEKDKGLLTPLRRRGSRETATTSSTTKARSRSIPEPLLSAGSSEDTPVATAGERQRRKSSAEEELATAIVQKEDLSKQVKELEKQVESLKSSASEDLQSKVATLESRMQRMAQMNEKLSTAKEELEKGNESLEAEKKALTAQLAEAAAAREGLASELREAKSKTERMFRISEKLKATKDELEKDTNEKTVHRAKSVPAARKSDASKDAAELLKRNKELEKRLRGAERKLQEWKTKVELFDQLQGENASLEQSVRTALTSLQNALLTRKIALPPNVGLTKRNKVRRGSKTSRDGNGEEDDDEEEGEDDDEDDEEEAESAVDDEETLRLERERRDLLAVADALQRRKMGLE